MKILTALSVTNYLNNSSRLAVLAQRVSLLSTGGLLLFFLTSCASPDTDGIVESKRAESPQTRPNIIFLLADDQRAETLSVAGHPYVRTPNLDRLAQEGVRYTNAYSVEPICAPSRFAFLSGQYERTNGLGFNSPYQVSAKQWQLTYPGILRKSGYHSGFIGKFGVEYYDFDGEAADQFDYWQAHDGWLPFFPKELTGNPATKIYADSMHDITTEIMGESITTFLRNRPPDKPFNLSVSFSAPHNSVVSSMYPEGSDSDCSTRACEVMGHPANENPDLHGHPVYDTLYRDAGIRISDDVGTDPFQFIPKGVLNHEKRKQWYSYNYDRRTEQEHLIRYYQTITGIDAVVGRLIKELQALAIADNTIIIYSSDHGLLNGEYSTGGKALLYDLVAKIPLIIFDPRQPMQKRGRIDDRLIASIDVPATILSYADAQVPVSMQGQDINSNSEEDIRSEIFLESLTVAEGNPFIEAIRTQDWKYVRYLAAKSCPYTEADLDFSKETPIFEQLFDLRNDPAERVNLASVTEHLPTREGLRAQLAKLSSDLTVASRNYKAAMNVPLRPSDQAYCW